MSKDIKVGVIGISRGMSFAHGAALAGMKFVALCDKWEERLMSAEVGDDVARYTDYNEFLRHDMDAVVLANYFHEHAPFAIKALRSGKHVLSETMCNATLSEGVELCQAVEDTGLIYMLAENYPYTKFNQELRRIYKSGELGRATYAEGEYNHPMSAHARNEISQGRYHWRNWLPPSYYCTHALAPLIYITELMPKSVVCLSIPAPEVAKGTMIVGDKGYAALCQMENDAVFRLFGLSLPGHSNFYRIHGTKGAAEILRGPGYFGPEQIRVWHEPWNMPPDQPEERVYVPSWPERGELAEKAGHGGGDFWTEFYFAEAIRTKTQPFLDVYRGVAMSSLGILAWRSALSGGMPQQIPDFKDKSDRKKYENDNINPFPVPGEKEHALYPSVHGKYTPSAEDEAAARSVWEKQGFLGE